jgi:hypothetical protein
MPDSWWIKFKRAQHHMVELRRCAALYASSHPYAVVGLADPRGQGRLRRYGLHFEEPDPMIVAVLGDFIHNLRSALDQIVVACSPPLHRTRASFPFAYEDLFARSADGTFLHPDGQARENFRRAVRGLKDNPDALAVVLGAQPYQRANPALDILGILSRLENADKHRAVIAVGSGLRAGALTTISRGIVQSEHRLQWDQFFYADTEILRHTLAAWVEDADVQVVAHGIATIGVKVTALAGNEPPTDLALNHIVLGALREVRLILRLMEPFVIRA